jgi:hypothetical protein
MWRSMATETTTKISGKMETNFCFEDNLEKTYYFKFDAN